MGIVAYSLLARGLVTGRSVIYPLAESSDKENKTKTPIDSSLATILKKATPDSPTLGSLRRTSQKNLGVTKRLQVIAKKHNATPRQITLAWILAEHPNCRPLHFIMRNICDGNC